MKNKGLYKSLLIVLSIFVMVTTVVTLSFKAIALDTNEATVENGVYLDTESVNNKSRVTDENPVSEKTDENQSTIFTDTNSNYKNNISTFSDTNGDTVVYVEANESTFPEGTEMKIEEVAATDDIKAVIEKSDVISNDQVITDIKAVDVSFYDKDDNKQEPEGTVKVSISASYMEDINSGKAILVHIKDDGTVEEIKTKDITVKDIETVAEATKEEVKNNNNIDEINTTNTVSFETDSFSTYAVVYTVDFYYGDYEYHLEGGKEIYLHELFNALGIDTDINDVTDVKFSNNDLVKVYKVEGNYVLESVKPFNTTETLTITTVDGEIVVRVEDEKTASISGQIIDARISGGSSSTSGDTWYITDPTGQYQIDLVFKESASNQFPSLDNPSDNKIIYTYQLPKGIQIHSQNGTTKFTNTTLGIDINIPWTLSEDGLLTFTLDNVDKNYKDGTMTAYGVFNNAVSAGLKIHFDGSWDQKTNPIVFSADVQRTIDTSGPKPGTLDLSKSAYFEDNTNRIKYYINLKVSDGGIETATITDTLSNATGITIDQSSIRVYTYSYGEEIQYSHTVSGNTNTFVFSNLQKDHEYHIEYYADIDFNLLDTDKDGKITINPKNEVTDGKVTKESEISREISYTNVNKSVGTQSDIIQVGDKYYRELEWTIRLNDKKLADLSNTTIKDTITSTNPPMVYTGSGIKILSTDSDGHTSSTDINWDQLNSYDPAKEWSYIFPANSKGKSYVITYKTRVDVTNLEDNASVNNTVEGQYGKANSEGHVGPASIYGVTKEVISSSTTDQQTTWKITLNIPSTGLSKAEIIDSVPVIYKDNSPLYDKLISYSVDTSNLVDGESFVEDYKNDSGFRLVFYKGDNIPGLKATGQERTIEVTVITKVNDSWVNDHSLSIEHINTARFNNKQVTASKNYTQKTISKSVKQPDWPKTYSYNNVEYTCFQYSVILTGVDGEITLEDNMNINDALYWQTNSPFYDNLKVYYGRDQWNYQESGVASVNQSSTSVSTNASFTISDSNLKKDSNNEYYPYYKLVYYVFVPTSSLQDLAAHGTDLKANLINNVDWGSKHTSASYEIKYVSLDKKLLNENEINENNRIARYQITVNSLGARVNNGEAFKLEDEFSSSLAVDYSSITFSDPSKVISYSITGNVITFWIKDESPLVITYNARVLGTNSVNISNVARTEWANDKSEKTVNVGNKSEGEGASVVLHLMKVDGDNAKVRLGGVKFELHSKNAQIEADLSTWSESERVFTTDANGEVTISAPENRNIFFDTPYYLVEIPSSVPAGYSLINYNPEFTISENGTTADWEKYIFYNGYTLQVKNYLKKGNLSVEKSVISPDENDKTAREYEFTVTLYSSLEPKTIASTINGDYGNVSFVEGEASFKLKNSEKVSINGLPEGLFYEVKEHTYDDMSTKYNGVISEKATGTIKYNETENVKVTNTRTDSSTTSYSVSKKWKSGDADINWPNKVKAVEVTLYKTLNGITTLVTNDDVSGIENPKQINNENNNIDWIDLPLKYSVDGIEYEATYSAKETKIIYKDDSFDVTDVAANNNLITNELSFALNVIKVNKDDNSIKIPNAVFKLERINENSEEIAVILGFSQTKTTNLNGELLFDNLIVGYYKVEEISVPDGYVLSSDPAFYISIDEQGVHLLEKGSGAPINWKKDATHYGNVKQFESDSSTATVENSTGKMLPMTGGQGTACYIIVGVILILLSLHQLFYRNRRLMKD